MTNDKKRSNSADYYDQYINSLSGRYQNRGVSTIARSEEKEQIKREARTVKMSPSAYSSNIDERNCKSEKFMTSNDYVSYFNTRRNASFATTHPFNYTEDTSTEAATAERNTIPRRPAAEKAQRPVASAQRPRATSQNSAPRKAESAAQKRIAGDEDVKIREQKTEKKARPSENNFKTVVFNQVKSVESKVVKKAGEIATTWFPIESKDNRAAGVKRRFPLAAIATILTMSISLMLIVGSAVMVSSASTDLYSLQNEAEELKQTQSDLYEKLEYKNDLGEIENIAREELGMVSGDFVDIKYMDLSSRDVIESYDGNNDGNINFSTLLSAIASIFQ